MINEKIENFLEKVDMNYLFCLLSKLEAQRLNQLPSYVKNKFHNKIAVISMEHVAANDVPDYLSELAEAELMSQQENSPFREDEGMDYNEETVDDSEKYIEDLGTESLDNLNDDEDEDEEGDFFSDAGDVDDTEDADELDED